MQRRRSRRSGLAGYVLVGPSLFGVACFLVLPVLIVLALSLFRWDLIAPATFVGLDNWGSVLTDAGFGGSLVVTLAFVVIVIPVQTALGLAAATLLTRGLPGSAVFRAIFVLPWISAPLALGVVWKWILAPTGGALDALIGTRVEWLSDPILALPTVAAVVVWSNVGYITLFFVAGLTSIPSDVLEAARLDGAGPIAVFWRISVPLIRPTMFFVLVTSVITVAQLFDQIYALTDGGPQGVTDVVAHHIYTEAFTAFDLGRAAVMAIILFALLVVVSIGQQAYFRRRITYDLT